MTDPEFRLGGFAGSQNREYNGLHFIFLASSHERARLAALHVPMYSTYSERLGGHYVGLCVVHVFSVFQYTLALDCTCISMQPHAITRGGADTVAHGTGAPPGWSAHRTR